MNKKLLSVAIGAALGAAPLFAQADVVVYGQLQAELAGINSDAVATAPDGVVVSRRGHDAYMGSEIDERNMDDNKRGRLGVKASEKLGNGMTAIAKFEWQVDTTQGDPNDGNRESYVGLKGDWGTFTAGSLKSAYKYTGGVTYDPFVTTYIEARRHGAMSNGTFGHGAFMTDSLGYDGKFGGIHVRATYSPDESANSGPGTVDDGDYTASLAYEAGNWEAFVATAHDKDNSPTGPHADYDAWKVGGKYKFGNNTILAQYEDTTQDVTTGGSNDGKIWFLGYHLQMGNNTLVAEYGNGKVDIASSATDQKDDFYAVGLIHKMSKKTRVFGGYSKTTLDNSGGDAASDGDRDAWTIGMRVDF